MAWIESHQAIGNHPKTMALAEVLKVKLPTAVGHLHYLWWWALDYAQDGDIGRFDPKVIAHACHWTGRPQAFVDGLIAAGFIDTSDDGRAIHDWQEYAVKLIDRRAANRERMRAARADHVRRTGDTDPAHVHRTSGTRASHVQNGVHARVELPDQPDRTNRTGPDQPTVPDARGRAAAGEESDDDIDYEQIVEPNGRVRNVLVEKRTAGEEG